MGGRKTIRGSRYGLQLDIMERMHWTWQELTEQPADLIDELTAKMIGRAKADKKRQQLERVKNGRR